MSSSSTAVDLAVVIPTRNERENIGPLVDRLSRALVGLGAELIFVDDSTDGTAEVIEREARRAGFRVRCLHREPGEQAGGLGGAVVAGLRAARGRFAVVMDGDLQHPPEMIPELIDRLEGDDADLVVASRYNGAGSRTGLASSIRVAISRISTLATRALFPRKLRSVSDPMSGFFAVRLGAIDVAELRPLGFKILLEIVARGRLRVAEVGFRFGRRHAGESKASIQEGMRFLRHMLRLRVSTALTATQRRAIAFATVGATGIVVNAAAFWVIDEPLGVHYLIAVALATQVSTTWNFIGSELFVFRGAKRSSIWRRFVGFSAVNNTVMLLRLPVIVLLVNMLSTPKTVANAITLVMAFVVRFSVSDRFIYEDKPESLAIAQSRRDGPVEIALAAPGRNATNRFDLPVLDRDRFDHYYDIHGIVTIGSDAALPELEYFRLCPPASTNAVGTKPDIAIRIGRVGTVRRRCRLVRSDDGRRVSWEEHLGAFSANFAVEFDNQILVTASRALARSPHVLYTNLVEPLLRFALVHRDCMLLHSACLELDGRGVMLSARTDTGKTGTILQLVRKSGAKFLSDDMSIIDDRGCVRSFPKPLTISQHTLRAVNSDGLSRSEWLRLRVQSRLHSKEGRSFAMQLADYNLPIMTINGWVQRLVPPPKYMVERLVPCDKTAVTYVRELFIIERGMPHHSMVQQVQAIAELLENTEDAYGFPPYRYLAPALRVGGMDFEYLREKERLILISAMESVRAHRLGSNDFSWGDRILELTQAGGSEAELPTRPASSA